MTHMDTGTRRQAVSDLIELRRPLEEAITTLQQYPWDSEEELVEFGSSELLHALDSFLIGALSAEQLEAWANAVEGRDDIGFRPSTLIDLVAELANPMLFSPLTHESIQQIMNRLPAIDG